MYLDRFSRNLAKTDKISWFFGIENREIDFFFIFFSTKVSDFVLNLHDDCSQLSFELYNVFVGQKLPISRSLNLHIKKTWKMLSSSRRIFCCISSLYRKISRVKILRLQGTRDSAVCIQVSSKSNLVKPMNQKP